MRRYKVAMLAVAMVAVSCVLAVFFAAPQQDFTAPAIPFVRMNDAVYYLSYTCNFLSENYVVIGEITAEVTSVAEAQNGASAGCKIGEKIFQSPQNTDELFVYTRLFSGDGYRYVRFKMADSD